MPKSFGFGPRLLGLASGLAFALASVDPCFSEVSQLRIGAQYGLGYLPLYVARDAGLIDMEMKKAGLPPIPVDIKNFAGGPEINDGLLSGSLDIGSGGVTAMILAWDRTRTAGDREMRGIAALSTLPYVLMTNDPSIRQLKDLTGRNRIGVPAVKTSVPSVMLSIAAARQYGQENANHFDAMTVAVAQPDGATALLTHNGLVDGYTFAPPFVEQMAGHPGVTKVWSSAEVFETPATAISAWTTARFRNANPRTYAAFLAALRDAMAMIANDRTRVGQIYLRAESSRLVPTLIEQALSSPGLGFAVAPSNVGAIADAMAQTRILKSRPASWKDLFFPEIQNENGN